MEVGHVQGTTLQFRKGMEIEKDAVKNYLVSHLGLESNGEIQIKQFASKSASKDFSPFTINMSSLQFRNGFAIRN